MGAFDWAAEKNDPEAIELLQARPHEELRSLDGGGKVWLGVALPSSSPPPTGFRVLRFRGWGGRPLPHLVAHCHAFRGGAGKLKLKDFER